MTNARAVMRLRQFVFPAGVALLSGGALAFGSLTTGRNGTAGVVFLVLGFLFTAMASFVTARMQGSVQQAKQEQERAAVLEAALGPVAEYMGRLATNPTGHDDLLGSINDRLVETAAELAHPAARSTFYTLRDGERCLERRASSDTNSSNPLVIDRGDEKGDFLIGIALGTRDRWVENLKTDPDEWRVSLSDGYHTARIMRVRAGERPLGLLIVEAPGPGDLPGGRHLLSLLAIARLLGASQVIKGFPLGGPTAVPRPAARDSTTHEG